MYIKPINYLNYTRNTSLVEYVWLRTYLKIEHTFFYNCLQDIYEYNGTLCSYVYKHIQNKLTYTSRSVYTSIKI